MNVEWAAHAIEDRNEVFDYLESENPQAALSVDERIETQISQLIQFPERGRPGRVEGTRELVISGTPYIAAYRVTAAIRILRILHSAQQWPNRV